jgi:hypothetical protein
MSVAIGIVLARVRWRVLVDQGRVFAPSSLAIFNMTCSRAGATRTSHTPGRCYPTALMIILGGLIRPAVDGIEYPSSQRRLSGLPRLFETQGT